MNFKNIISFKHQDIFENISGYDDIKEIVKRALASEDNYNLLLTDPPASAKTLFLMGIIDREHNAVYFTGSKTNRTLDVLEEQRPKIICIDELDKMSKQFQNKMLNFMENGRKSPDAKILRLK
ncbi:MAG: AAA family ATPase [Candidatus Nitrosopolaris sp.]